jgi:hypothetical protein
MYKKKSQGGMSFVLAMCLAMVVAGASARPAHADGGGCSVWSQINLPTVTIPAGWLCLNVYGSGLNIHNMNAYWRTGTLCNWRIDWVIYNNGKTWWRDNGPVHGCDHITGTRVRGAGRAPDHSDICAELYNTARNVKIDAVCAGIER